jgi:ribose 5-phosphate isomerase A
MDSTELKRRVGHQALDALVQSGMKLGLGTGSTAVHVVRRLGEQIRLGKLTGILAVATSFQTEVECHQQGLSLRSLNDPEIDGHLDLTIDGADEVDPQWRLIKGGGGALLIEKIVAHASQDYAIVVDSSKIVTRLGEKAPIPVEIVSDALLTVTRRLEELGEVVLRMATMKDGPVITDHGNFILDVTVHGPFDPQKLELKLKSIPGVMANGLFTRPVSHLFVAYPDGRVELKQSAPV